MLYIVYPFDMLQIGQRQEWSEKGNTSCRECVGQTLNIPSIFNFVRCLLFISPLNPLRKETVGRWNSRGR
jgi:hypothetical protein